MLENTSVMLLIKKIDDIKSSQGSSLLTLIMRFTGAKSPLKQNTMQNKMGIVVRYCDKQQYI